MLKEAHHRVYALQQTRENRIAQAAWVRAYIGVISLLIRSQARSVKLSALLLPLQVGGGVAPQRLRVLDLPFSAVEWGLPGDAPALAPEGLPSDRWALFARSPLARERSMTGFAIVDSVLVVLLCSATIADVLPVALLRRCPALHPAVVLTLSPHYLSARPAETSWVASGEQWQ